MNTATVATGMRAQRDYILFIQLGPFCCHMEGLGKDDGMESTSIFMRLDAVVWECQVHCILQIFALLGSRISQIFFLQPFFFPNHVHESKQPRGKKVMSS